MEDLFLQKITIYHKISDGKYERYVTNASFRNTTDLINDNYQLKSSDTVIVRIFDKSFVNKVEIEDVIVNKEIKDTILKAPQSELRKKYGQNNVYKVTSKSVLLFNDKIGDIEHIKLGCK